MDIRRPDTEVQENEWSQAEHMQEQDKSSDIDQQPPFGDRKISNIQPQNKGGGGYKTNRNII